MFEKRYNECETISRYERHEYFINVNGFSTKYLLPFWCIPRCLYMSFETSTTNKPNMPSSLLG